MQNQGKNYILSFLFLILAVGIIVNLASADEIRINIGLRSQPFSMKTENLVAQYGGKKVKAIPAINVATYAIPEEVFEKVKFKLLRHGGINFVERDHIRTTFIDKSSFNMDMIPNDPYYPDQWGPIA